MIETLLETISQSAVATFMAEDPVAFPWVEAAHVLSIVTVFGSILLIDLRLMGLSARDYPVMALSRTILPVTWVAFVLAVITGGLMFASNPYGYFGNMAFRAKMVLLVLAGINMMVFHFVTMRGGHVNDGPAPLPVSARLAGFLSAAIWLGVIACGRWIGFTMAPF